MLHTQGLTPILPTTAHVVTCWYEASTQGVVIVSHKSARPPTSCLYLLKECATAEQAQGDGASLCSNLQSKAVTPEEIQGRHQAEARKEGISVHMHKIYINIQVKPVSPTSCRLSSTPRRRRPLLSSVVSGPFDIETRYVLHRN